MAHLLPRITDAAPASIGAALRQSILDELLNSPEDVVVVRDVVDGRYRYANPRFCELLGLPSEQIVGRTDHDLFPADVANAHVENDRRILGDGYSRTTREQLADRSGRLSQFVARRFVVHNAAGRPEAVGVIGTDITSLEADNARDGHVESRFRMVFDHASIGQVYSDMSGTVTSVNQPLATMLGYEPEEMVGRPTTTFVPPDEHAAIRSEAARLLEGNEVARRAVRRFVHRDGRLVPVSVTSALLRDTTGEPAWWVSMVLDLTEEERTATELAIAHAAALAAGARMRLLHAVASACNEATSLDSAAPAILRLVCEHFAWDSGCLARLDDPVGGDVPALEVVHGVGDSAELAAHTSTQQLTGTADGNATLSGRDVVVPVSVGRVDGRVWLFRTGDDTVDEDQLEVLTLIGIATSQVIERTTDARRLRESEERFRAVFDSSPLPMGLTLGDEGTYSEVNAALCDLLGYAPDVLRGMSAADLLHPDDVVLADPAGAAAAAAPDGRHSLEMRLLHSSGKVITSRVTLAWMDGADGGRQLLAQMEDVTARRAAEDMLRWQAGHDSLTGLANRAELGRVLAEQGEAGAVCALLFIDLDGFKLINDTRGHEVGDDVLVGIAARLLDAVRPSDVVARFGGDEFVIVCRDVSLEPGSDRAQRVADRIEAALIAPFDTVGGPAHVTASIGIAAGRVDAREPQELLLRADKAMYRAKTLGRDRQAVYDEELHQRATERSRTEAALRTALDDGRFVLHFQPVVELDSATVVGFEALVRLINERGDIVAPAEFITVAEQSGLIIAMGTWVLRESCRTIADLRARSGRRLTVSVNVSARQAAKLDFADVVCDALASSGLPNDALMLELTESSLLEADESTLRQLVMLRDRGVGIALDDFGTGYSSLSYLRRLPVSCLKIDRSFVSDIVETDSDRAIVRAVIGLAEDLGLGWIAEGIETAEQLEVLAGTGSGGGQGQGYLFSRPVPADRLADVLGIPAAEPSPEPPTR